MTSSPTIERARPAVAPARVPASDRDQPRRGSSLFGRSTNALLVVLVAFGSLLHVWGVGANRLGYDEAFTAMAGRRSLGDLFDYLRLNDSHPPLDYLIRLPLARAGVDELWFRMPSVACSVAALALFAWWMRRRGVAGVIATGLLAVSAFQLIHGRTGRMYAELELLGVVAAVLSDGWLRRPRRWPTPAIGVLVFLTLLTHVSGFLLAAGLFALVPGFRRDREAWRWRADRGRWVGVVAAVGAVVPRPSEGWPFRLDPVHDRRRNGAHLRAARCVRPAAARHRPLGRHRWWSCRLANAIGSSAASSSVVRWRRRCSPPRRAPSRPCCSIAR